MAGSDKDGPEGRRRLDLTLVARRLLPTRARARDVILRGHVRVDGKTVTKPAQAIAPESSIEVDDSDTAYVSRAALKLAAGLDHFGYDPAGRVALDIGAATGGFTEILLARGARKVLAVDVGHGQLHPRLADDPRVVRREGVNARNLAPGDIGETVEAIVVDVSFISLRLVLPAVLRLAGPKAWGIFLVKPQFEVGRGKLGKGGIVRDAALARQTADDMAEWLRANTDWQVDGVLPSPIAGGDGNAEFLIGARHG